jgi:hypothetical protein
MSEDAARQGIAEALEAILEASLKLDDVQSDPKPLMEIREPAMKAEGYSAQLWRYLLGKWHVMLLKRNRLGVPMIVRELCTYNRERALEEMVALMLSPDPEAHCELLAMPWNCEGNGGRIRLDNKPEDKK